MAKSVGAVIKDKVEMRDAVEVVAFREPEVAIIYPCPSCGTVSKKDHDPGTRICFNLDCRTKFAEADVTPVEIVNGPAYPCLKCGRETKVHHNATRICSHPGCRHIHVLPAPPT